MNSKKNYVIACASLGLIGWVGCAEIPSQEEQLGAAQQSACAASKPTFDPMLRAMAAKEACDDNGCLMAIERTPKKLVLSPIEPGDEIPAELCYSKDGETCSVNAEWHCEFGGECNCHGFIDCLDMAANCVPGTEDCGDQSWPPTCSCENADGC